MRAYAESQATMFKWLRAELLIVAGFLAVLGLCTIYLHQAEQAYAAQRQAILDTGRERAQQLAEAVRQQFALSFGNADFVLRSLRSSWNTDPARFTDEARKMFALMPAGTEPQISVFAADGGLIATTAAGAAGRNLAGSPLFETLQQARGDDVLIARPQFSAVRRRWELPFMRRLETDGHFAGVLEMSVSPLYFSREMARIGLGPRDTVGAAHIPDGSYIARNSGMPALLGEAVNPHRPYLPLDAPATGTFIAMATHEPVERLFAWNRVDGLPVVAFVGLATPDMLSAFEAEIALDRFGNRVGVGLVLGLALAASGLAVHGVRQNRALKQQKALYFNIFEHNLSVKYITDPATGRIVFANRAASRFYGYPADVLAGMRIDRINIQPFAASLQAMNDALSGRQQMFVFRHRLASGEVRTVEVYPSPIEIDGRRLLYSLVHDITERAALEARLKASEELYRSLFDVVTAGMIVLDGDGHITRWNRSALAILATDDDGLQQRSKPIFTHEGVRVADEARPSRRALREDLQDELYYAEGEDGRRVWAAISSRRLPPDDSGRPGGAVIAISDITDVIRLEERLLISQRVFDATSEGIAVTDGNGRIVQVNRAFCVITGYSQSDVLGVDARILLPTGPDQSLAAALTESVSSKGSWEGEIENRRKDGTSFAERIVSSALHDRDGRLIGSVTLISDVTERKRREDEVWRRANFDALTGLPNRTLLDDRLGQALARSERLDLPAAVLFIDLDRFKPVNDTWGHTAGDELLQHVAGRIRACVRAEDTVARLGGDEFVVVLPMVHSESDAAAVATKILRALSAPYDLTGIAARVDVGASIGVAVARGGESDAGTLLARADAAMYRGKAAGRGRVVCAGPAAAPDAASANTALPDGPAATA
ncbi:PAS domain S-box protein, partial [Pseudoxanthobacter sp.]|uniref:PAS domain S-box protein n=1 Tax=Pseudoxanthobacter sp. TaxID=1925742 RepID=UPI002FE1A6B5